VQTSASEKHPLVCTGQISPTADAFYGRPLSSLVNISLANVAVLASTSGAD